MFKEIHDEQEIDNWAKDGESLAEAGRINWSDYYSQYLQKIAATPVTNRALVVERLGIMITASQFYEQGRLDRDGFDSVRRIIRTYQTIDDAAANLLAREALVRVLGRPSRNPRPRRIDRADSRARGSAGGFPD
jgi:hypothetical protein